jgi:hypothetical protein
MFLSHSHVTFSDIFNSQILTIKKVFISNSKKIIFDTFFNKEVTIDYEKQV